ncbi:MAG: single-stranded DNA-binding protein, partial [Rhodoferax sp.]|nr:single-stranded DNA-binding protein [Rhodoferax sp.]
RSVYIEGRLKTRKYTDKDGVEKYATDIIANEMQMLGGREGMGDPGGHDGDNEGYSRPSAPPSRPPPRQQTPAPAPAASKSSSGFDDMDDDIPF